MEKTFRELLIDCIKNNKKEKSNFIINSFYKIKFNIFSNSSKEELKELEELKKNKVIFCILKLFDDFTEKGFSFNNLMAEFHSLIFNYHTAEFLNKIKKEKNSLIESKKRKEILNENKPNKKLKKELEIFYYNPFYDHSIELKEKLKIFDPFLRNLIEKGCFYFLMDFLEEKNIFDIKALNCFEYKGNIKKLKTIEFLKKEENFSLFLPISEDFFHRLRYFYVRHLLILLFEKNILNVFTFEKRKEELKEILDEEDFENLQKCFDKNVKVKCSLNKENDIFISFFKGKNDGCFYFSCKELREKFQYRKNIYDPIFSKKKEIKYLHKDKKIEYINLNSLYECRERYEMMGINIDKIKNLNL